MAPNVTLLLTGLQPAHRPLYSLGPGQQGARRRAEAGPPDDSIATLLAGEYDVLFVTVEGLRARGRSAGGCGSSDPPAAG
jgi:hypothetical protein